MRFILLALAQSLSALLGLGSAAQDGGKRTIATRCSRSASGNELARRAYLNVMEAYGFFNSLGRVVLNDATQLDRLYDKELDYEA